MRNSHKPAGNMKVINNEKINEFDALQRKLDEFIEAENAAGLAVQNAEYTPDSQHRLDHFVDDLQKQMDAFEMSARRQKTAKATAAKQTASPADGVKPAPEKRPEINNVIKEQPAEVQQKAAESASASSVQAAGSAKQRSGLWIGAAAVIVAAVWFSWPAATIISPPEQLVSGQEGVLVDETPESRQMLATALPEPAAGPEIKEAVIILPELTVTADVANARSEASSSAAVVTRLKQGDVVEMTGEQGDWYLVGLPDGSKAWAHHSLFAGKTDPEPALTAKQVSDVEALMPTPALVAPVATEVIEAKVLTVTVKLGNVRSEPNSAAEVLFRLKQGTKVLTLKREGDWLQVRIKDTLAWAHYSIF